MGSPAILLQLYLYIMCKQKKALLETHDLKEYPISELLLFSTLYIVPSIMGNDEVVVA